MLSKRQNEILHLISSFTEAQGHSPTYREIQHMLGLSSVGTVQKHIHELKAKGLLKTDKKWRSIEPQHAPLSSLCRIPVIGALSKTTKIELFASISFCHAVVPTPGNTYYGFIAKDDSFISEHILKEDLLILEARNRPQEEEYILVSLSESTSLIGYYSFLKEALLHENFIVHGVIVSILRNFQ